MYLKLCNVSTGHQDCEDGTYFGKLQSKGIICFLKVYSPDISFFVDAVYLVESVGGVDPEGSFDRVGNCAKESFSAALRAFSECSL